MSPHKDEKAPDSLWVVFLRILKDREHFCSWSFNIVKGLFAFYFSILKVINQFPYKTTCKNENSH